MSTPAWAESAAGVPASGLGSEYAALPQSTLDDHVLWKRIRAIAETKRRSGCHRIYARLRRILVICHPPKIERLYREEGLSLRRRARKKATAIPRVALLIPARSGLCYAMDFVHCRLANGWRFKCFTMIDPCSKEVQVIEVDGSIRRGLVVPHS